MANPKGINQYSGGAGGSKSSNSQRIQILAGRLNSLSSKAPLRTGVAIKKELRSLGWGRK